MKLSSVTRILSELKRRKVYRAASVYIVVGLGILGAAELVLDPLGLAAARPFIVILVLLGLPLTVVLAWAYELKPDEHDLLSQKNSDATAPGDRGARKSIVVLPFDNLSPRAEDAYFSDGLTEEIITSLASLRSLRVISRSTAMVLKGTQKDVRAIGRELDVGYVLEGSVRKAGDELRVVAQLIDARTDEHILVERHDGTMRDVFAIQERIAKRIVHALRVKLSPEDHAALTPTTSDLRVYECALRARSYVQRFTEDGIREGISVARRGLEEYGEEPLLLAVLGDAFARLANIALSDQEDLLGQAHEYATRLARIQADSAHVHYVNGLVDLFRGNIQDSVRSLKRALAEHPQDPDILFWLVEAYGMSGHPEAARPLAARLALVDPLMHGRGQMAGWVELTDGRFDQAVGPFREWYNQAPDSPYVRWCYALVLILNGSITEALSVLDKTISESPTTFWATFARLQRAALTGDSVTAAAAATPQFVATVRRTGFFSWVAAGAYGLLNERDAAIDWLETAASRGFINYPLLHRYDPTLANIRSESRFERLMESVRARWLAFEP